MKRLGKPLIFRAVIVAAACLAPPALFGQTMETLATEAYELVPQEAPLPLGQLVDTDAPLPDLAELDFDAPVAETEPGIAPELWVEAGLPDAVPLDAEAVREGGAGSGMEPVETPATWARHDFEGTEFAVPGDWAVMEEDDLELVVFSGDTSPPTGHILMISISDSDGDSIDEVIASAEDDGGVVGDRGEIALPGGEVFEWADLEMKLGGVAMDVRMYVSRSMFTEDRAPFLLSVGTVGAAEPFDPAVRDAFLSSFRFAPQSPLPEEVPEQESAGTGQISVLSGRLTFTPPSGWMVIEYPDEAALTAPDSSGSVRFLRGVELRQRLARLPDGTRHEEDTLAGYPVRSYETTEGTLSVWTHCPRPDEPLAVLVAGDAGFFGPAAHDALFGGLAIEGMEGAPECAFAAAALGGERDEAADAADTAGGEPDRFEEIGGGYTTYRNARYGTEVSYPGTYFVAQAAPGSGDGRRFEAVDGQAHFIVFTQYDALDRGLSGMLADIRAEMDEVQEETSGPGVFEITGTEGQTRRFFKVIRNADGLTRRLEITYPVAREAEFRAVVSYMARSFGPPPELSVSVPQPPAPVSVPQPPDAGDEPAPVAPPQGERVTEFSNGRANGWSGLLSTVEPKMTGGPEGRGYLESVSPGDGHDGYYVAPPEFHGDWRDLDTIEVQIRGASGDYYGALGRKGVDIVIESDRGWASTGFDREVAPFWATQRVRLDDPGRWTLTRGASRLEDVLANVTGFRIRAEYILGDTSGGLARVVVVVAGPDDGQSADPAMPRGGPDAVTLGNIFTPERGTATRGELMDAARVPIQGEIGVPILFVVDVLNTDGHWAYLQARPVNRDGTPVNWDRTRFAREMAGGFMSDVVMVLFRKEFGNWGVIDYVLGPTDVAWYEWVERYGFPEWFFMK
ncbi:hypothetical protein SAMN04490248_11154 [Salinihabitans flavidus]|uniref:Uncharacterized protein n=1 Tax=Salinihabitans flavidus TaxID=569882 RepID=A0A1H8S9D3_9RHOB|nr:hypothetical protein [Salinihabitans flavidus]SEO75167.1 hypothetical protein SAMN04490248_11154 [Salinihabitans flavidus]